MFRVCKQITYNGSHDYLYEAEMDNVVIQSHNICFEFFWPQIALAIITDGRH